MWMYLSSRMFSSLPLLDYVYDKKVDSRQFYQHYICQQESVVMRQKANHRPASYFCGIIVRLEIHRVSVSDVNRLAAGVNY